MAHRHTPRQPERDVRLHDPHAHHPHAHSLPPPPHALAAHPAALNGGSIPSTPLASGSAPPPPASIVTSPAVPKGVNGVVVNPPAATIQKLAQANEQTWLLIGGLAEQMGNLEHALSAYENALRHNPMSLSGLTQVAGIARIKENYPKAIEYFQRVIKIDQNNGEVWSALGHCYLMQDDLQQAYAAYQQALYLLPNPKEDPKLWYGIGILYDRYGSLDHAEEAFASVLRMDKDFDKANEILFRLGIIYKQQGKYNESLECFDRILRNPPNPLAHADIWFQIGHVYEQQHDYLRAREAYERVVQDNPTHAKVLQQLGWLYHQDGSSFQNQELAIQYLTKSLEADPSDAQSWYLLGRAYMAGQKYNKAYEAYQQAVYRDGRNPTFWCSIGVLYFQINQYRDALDAYSRAIRINPYISEVWFDLGSLYESCNNQISDAIDAYARAAELDPQNMPIAQRLALLRQAQATGASVVPSSAPTPQDVHPTAYANPMIPQPAGLSGPPLMMQGAAVPGPRSLFRSDSRGPLTNELPLPHPPTQLPGRSSPGPFGGRPPPPVVLDDNQRPPTLAPMDVDRPPSLRDIGPYGREGPGPRGPSSILLHQPVPQQQGPPSHHDAFSRPIRMPSASASPPPHSARQLPPFNERPPQVGPGQTAHHSRSPRMYAREPMPVDREAVWERERRMVPADREWERERERGRDFPPQGAFYPMQARPQSPSAFSQHRTHSIDRSMERRESPTDVSPRNANPGYPRFWEQQKAMNGNGVPPPPRGRSPASRSSMSEAMEPPARRYDPCYDGRQPVPREREYEREPPPPEARYTTSPEVMRMRAQNLGPPLPPSYATGVRASQSPRMGPADAKPRQVRRSAKASPEGDAPPTDQPKKRRRAVKRKEDTPQRDGPSYVGPGSAPYAQKNGGGSQGSPEPMSSGSGSGSANRSAQPSPTNSVHLPPPRSIDEDYDEGVAEALVTMASYRGGPSDPRSFSGPVPGSAVSTRSPPSARMNAQMSPHAMSPHTMTKNPLLNRPSPPLGTKRPLSPGPDDTPDLKRSRVGSMSRRMPSPTNAASSSTRPSPIPFRQQPTSHSPEIRGGVDPTHSYPSSPAMSTPLPQSLPMPPSARPVNERMALAAHGPGVPGSMMHAHPHSRSPTNSATSPTMEEHMRDRDSASPRNRDMPPKREIVLHTAAGSPQRPASKNTPSPPSSNHSAQSAGRVSMLSS
ncbi:hypothetical protein EIP86_011573 [Pleurotus ostreatoroseus]|nr:hypothetical protein EIP86_011573 [Pleurotus ostreatoroseus]